MRTFAASLVFVAALATGGCSSSANQQTPTPASPAPPAEKAGAESPTGGHEAAGDSKDEAAASIGILLLPDGAWLGASSGYYRKVGKCGAKLDLVALSKALCKLRKDPAVARLDTLELAATKAVAYEDIIAIMDVIVGAGYGNLRFGEPQSLSLKLPHRDAEPLPSACGQQMITCAVRGPAGEI
jgi:hypothetical protein